MSQRAYARYREMAVFSVQTAIKTGRISTLPDGQIDSDVADREWAQNTKAHTQIFAAPHRSFNDEDGGSGGEGFGAQQYSKARAIREGYQARLAKLEYEERSAGLVPAADVKVAAFNTYRRLCDVVLQIPDRLAPVLVAEGNEAAVHTILSSEIRRALIEFADGAKG